MTSSHVACLHIVSSYRASIWICSFELFSFFFRYRRPLRYGYGDVHGTLAERPGDEQFFKSRTDRYGCTEPRLLPKKKTSKHRAERLVFFFDEKRNITRTLRSTRLGSS